MIIEVDIMISFVFRTIVSNLYLYDRGRALQDCSVYGCLLRVVCDTVEADKAV